jgi:hypothetical protein
MPSPGSTNRPASDELKREMDVEQPAYRAAVEWLLRAVMLIALALSIWQAVHLLGERPAVRASGSPTAIRNALAKWSTVEAPSLGHVVFDSVPPGDVRDWIAALPAVGTRASWEGKTLVPAAISIETVVDPKRSLRVWVAAPSRSTLVIRDSLGAIDSVQAKASGGVLTVADINGVVSASVGGTSATSEQRDSVTVRPVVVVGTAGWEGKFILASLEEYGWKVDARLSVGPTGDVVQGFTGANIDTARYSAVIAVDTAAAKYASAIGEFVRRGGGFIAVGDAAGLPAFASLLPGVAGAALPDAPFEEGSANPRHALAARPLTQLRPDAVVIETSASNNAVAARRVGMGRVLQVGYVDTWRWRMGGFDDPAKSYRGWWSAMVSSVAYAPRRPIAQMAATDPAPMATLVKTLGAPQPELIVRASLTNDPRFLVALFVAIVAALLIETASRRMRGKC